MNIRLLNWSKNNNILSDSQFGFKPGFSTVDAVFALNNIVRKSLYCKKKLYCCFVDYQKAFDSINRWKLFFKLTKAGVQGKMYVILKSLYENVKCCVKYKSEFSELFDIPKGLMQGEGLSPFLCI